jgi:hypothetical protein
MLTRRGLLSGVAFGGAAAFVARSAAAFTLEPMPKPVAGAFALACKQLAGGDHSQLIADAQAQLRQEISGGVLPANAQQIVVCPICGCRFTVTADSSF